MRCRRTRSDEVVHAWIRERDVQRAEEHKGGLIDRANRINNGLGDGRDRFLPHRPASFSSSAISRPRPSVLPCSRRTYFRRTPSTILNEAAVDDVSEICGEDRLINRKRRGGRGWSYRRMSRHAGSLSGSEAVRGSPRAWLTRTCANCIRRVPHPPMRALLTLSAGTRTATARSRPRRGRVDRAGRARLIGSAVAQEAP